MPERRRDTVLEAIRQRLAADQHPAAVADALRAVPRSRPFEAFADLERVEAPAIVVASRDEADPGHPYAVAETYARAIPAPPRQRGTGPGAAGRQGGRLSRVIAEVAAESPPAIQRTGRAP